ncbi:type IV pilin [Candidatus Woesearchaeota archaeon]|nr:type IV pilin [Candidatus Woesearchaeota archaeon]
MKNKRGISPVIATVLLVAIVIVIALIVFSWVRSMNEEAITKFDGTNIKLICEEVVVDGSYSSGFIYLSNTGNVPIYQLKAKVESAGAYETVPLTEGWPEGGLLQGGTYSGPISVTGEKMLLIPVLIGTTSDNQERAYTCEERYGIEIFM